LGERINKRILLGVCGGIAAYKSAELVRLLRKQGAEVRVVMTSSAMEFVTPLTFQALSGNAVHSQLLNAEQENAMGHINLARWADQLIIAPATANMIAKMSHGLADDLLSTLYLAATCPVVIAPAMNQAMWQKAVTQDNVIRLQEHGVTVLGPESGDQACGETGPGRMLEAAAICQHLDQDQGDGLLQGKSVLISAGPTREPIDPVRFISNRSSGKMGYAMAVSAQKAGAEVTLVSGPVDLSCPDGVNKIDVETAEQMYQAVLTRASDFDIYIGAAAVADYAPEQIQTEKIKKQQQQSNLLLIKTQDILASVARLDTQLFTVGFAAETEQLEQYAQNKLRDKNIDMIAANWVGREQGGFDKNENELIIFDRENRYHLAMAAKNHLADQFIALIAKKYNEKNTAKSTG
jgi:phosphopantothenoylcysteine decarboxylase/phosphopantothenate--cysteine ligase